MFKGHESFINCLVVTDDSKFIISCGFDTTVRVWNIEDKTQEFVFREHSSSVNSVAVTHNCQFILSAGRDKTVIL